MTMHFQAQAQSFTYAWPNTNFDLKNIDLGEVLSGGPPKDGIPPIDYPQFDQIDTASSWIAPKEPVISVVHGGQAKAYPLQIMTWHEIVNDEIGDSANLKSISVTFCPLCNASIVFDREVMDQTLDFGTTGLLRKSDLIMYDRQTESWWQQFTGKGIVGDFTDQTLTRIPSSIISFEAFTHAYPKGLVLNRQTGVSRNYGQNPYPGYDHIDNQPFLLQGPADDRLPPMERVLGISEGKQHRIYPFSIFDSQPLVQDHFAGKSIIVFQSNTLLSALDQASIAGSRQIAEVVAWESRTIDGKALTFDFDGQTLFDKQTRSTWNAAGQAVNGELKGAQLASIDSGVHFAFAWLAFNPETQIYHVP